LFDGPSLVIVRYPHPLITLLERHLVMSGAHLLEQPHNPYSLIAAALVVDFLHRRLRHVHPLPAGVVLWFCSGVGTVKETPPQSFFVIVGPENPGCSIESDPFNSSGVQSLVLVAAYHIDQEALAGFGTRPPGVCLGSLPVTPSEDVRGYKIHGAPIGLAEALVHFISIYFYNPNSRTNSQRGLHLH